MNERFDSGNPFDPYLGLFSAANVVLCVVIKVVTGGWWLLLAPVFYLPLLLIFLVTISHILKRASETGKRSAVMAPILWANAALLLGFLLQLEVADQGPAYMAVLVIGLGVRKAQALLPGWWEEIIIFWNVGVFLPTAFVLGWLRRKLERPLVPPA